MEKVVLLAKDFKGTIFFGHYLGGCAIEKAIMRETGLIIESVSEHTDRVIINDVVVGSGVFGHEDYEALAFEEDKIKAEAAGFDDTVIREIELWKINQ